MTSPPDCRCLIILRDCEFMAANQMFTAQLYCQTNNMRAQHKLSTESVNMLLLRKYFGNFARVGKNVKENILQKNIDTESRRYITMNVIIKQTKYYSGVNKQVDQDYRDIKMYEMKVNLWNVCEILYVYCFEVFVSKLQSFLFQKTKRLYFMEEDIVYKRSYR